MQPLVTIGVANYNNANYVLDTLNSIKAQNYPNVEVVIIDDCSADNSPAMIRDWLKDYNKPAKFIIHEKNRGVSAVCNEILKNAKGKYISLIATDDIMMPEKISIQVDIMEKTPDDVGIVYSDAYLIKEDGSPRFGLYMQRFRDFEDAPEGDVFNELLKGTFTPDNTMLFKSSCYADVGGYDEGLIYEDQDMLLRLARKYKFIYSDYVSLKYRLRKNSLSVTIRNWYASQLKVFAKHVNYSNDALNALEMTARNAYYERDKEALNSLEEYKHLSKYIATLNILWKLRIPRSIVRIMAKMGKGFTLKA